MRQRGFTLIEILLAVMVFAMLMLATFQIFDSVIRTNERSEKQFDQQNELNIAWAIMLQDLLQIRARTHRDIQGDAVSALQTNDEYLMQFIRGGLPPIQGITPGGMQLVAYSLEENILYRHSWAVLDLANDSEPFKQALISNIDTVTIEMLTKRNEWSEVWPPIDIEELSEGVFATAEVPRMFRINLTFTNEAEFNRLIPGPQQ